MQRQRGELVPIGEVIADLPGSVQSRRHFTLADQVDLLVGAREADPDMGFMGRLLALCSLPRTNPRNRKEYVRRNGPYALVMNAGSLQKLPYGSQPRLILSWLCTEAVKTQSRELVLGKSLSKFMDKLGMAPVGGARTRLRNQMKRLFGCSVTLISENESGFNRISSFVADKHEFWWDPKQPDQAGLWESKIRIGEALFNEIISHPVPIDINTLKALKRSPLGLDVYFWVVYRTFTLQSPQRLTWRQLYHQFGAHPASDNDRVTVRNFQRKFLRELKKIKLAWPELNYMTAPGVLILHPSTPAIPPGQQLQLVP